MQELIVWAALLVPYWVFLLIYGYRHPSKPGEFEGPSITPWTGNGYRG